VHDAFLSPEFSVSFEHRGPRAVARVRGELDLATASRLGRALEEAGRSRPEIVVDLADVGFLDDPTLRRLLRSQTRIELGGSRLAFTGPSPDIARGIASNALADRITVLPSDDAAFDPA